MHTGYRFALATLAAFSIETAYALECPEFPKTATKDWQVDLSAAIGRIGPRLSATEATAKVARIETDVLSKLPAADRIFLETMMYAAACSSIRDDRSLTESQRRDHLAQANEQLRAALELRLAATKPPSPLTTKNLGWSIPSTIRSMFVFAQDPKNQSPAGCTRLATEVSPDEFRKRIGFNMAEAKRMGRQLIIAATPGGGDWSATARRITFQDRELTPDVPYWCNGELNRAFLLTY